jgi:NAD+ kinase
MLHPLAQEILLQPIAAHLSLGTALVLPSEATVELEVRTTHQATLSIDGQIEVPLSDGAVVRVRRSPHITRLMRTQRSTLFYETLMQKLEKRE